VGAGEVRGGELDMVKLVPMTEGQFGAYFDRAVENYAQDLARAGNAHPDEARWASEQQFRKMLPEGLSSPGQYLYSIWGDTLGAGGAVHVGFLWLGIREAGARAFATLNDFWIFEEHRRQGYGSKALKALEDKVRELGFDEIRLHVFGHNHPARALYEKMGYVATNITMAKKLD
jgi:ribosomal protein S18 acetylase RimI-like enzyme